MGAALDTEPWQREWRERDLGLPRLVEAYEAPLRARGLIEFDDMPLLAVRYRDQDPPQGAIVQHFTASDGLQLAYTIDDFTDSGTQSGPNGCLVSSRWPRPTTASFTRAHSVPGNSAAFRAMAELACGPAGPGLR
jgi:hypothetical protein